MTCSTVTAEALEGLHVTQFLDRNDQFAKRWKQVAKVRLIYAERAVDLTLAEYNSLPAALKDVIKMQDSL